jgi:N-acetyl-anhydromuramyl-L-alanine amidase AmpD
VNDLTPTSTRPTAEPLRETRGAGPARRAALRSLRSRVQGLTNDPNDLFEPPRADRPWRYIVIHHSDSDAGNYAEIDQLHRERLGTAGCGYHFVIGNGSSSPDGQIEVTQRWADQKGGAHCRDAKSPAVNDYGIGICLVGDLDAGPPTERQVEAARVLVAYLQERYAIADDRVASHAQVAATPTACPGKHFPATAILGQRSLAAAAR